MKFIAYYRVSTDRQGQSGLGLEAQRKAVEDYLNGGKLALLKEYTEIESGKVNTRPQLEAAFTACRVYGAKLVIAKLDRLSRDACFLLGLEKAAIEFVCVDDPHMTPLTLGIRAVVAQHERELISKRTKEALAAAKARGTVLGGNRGIAPTDAARRLATEAIQARSRNRARDLGPTIKALQAAGAESLRAIAEGLNKAGIPTARGQGLWSATQVRRLLACLR